MSKVGSSTIICSKPSTWLSWFVRIVEIDSCISIIEHCCITGGWHTGGGTSFEIVTVDCNAHPKQTCDMLTLQ